ncbi:C45 family peptidase [bacterium]|nr:C45 family peptidase [bacterium]
MKRRIAVYSVIGLLALVLIGIGYFLYLSDFSGTVTATHHQTKTDGNRSTFRDGVVYRYPGMVPMLEVSGTHYEMGLQYGVLLKSEILSALESYEKILMWQAVKMGIPYKVLTAVARRKAGVMIKRLPKRFLEEMQGVADGSGISIDTIQTISMFYDVGESMGCTSILMKGKDGTVLHGRNQDATSFGGEEIGKMTVLVKYRPKGYNTVTQLDWPLFLGVETGYNDKGLAYSEETLSVNQPNPDGFSIVYLARLALEECDTIDCLYPLFDKHPVIGAYGTVWSDRDEGRGIVAELTSHGWSARELKGSILWNFNHIYDETLKVYQTSRVNLSESNRSRERIAAAFPQKEIYSVDDTIGFLRGHLDEKGRDYRWFGSSSPICNHSAQQMMVFHPQNDGVYLALGHYYAAQQKVYHIHNDFSKIPELYKEALPLGSAVEEEAKIHNKLISRGEKVALYQDLARRYPKDANAQFLAAVHSFRQKYLEGFSEFAEKAYVMNPAVEEYRLYAGLAAYFKKQFDKAVIRLEEIDISELYPYQKVYRITVLERIYRDDGSGKSQEYRNHLNRLLKEHNAQEYYQDRIVPLIDMLSQ